MKLTLLVAIAMLMSVSCKMNEEKKDETTPVQGNQPISVPKERNFTESETTIGKRICSALKNKRELFETLTDMQEQFRFKGEGRDCGAVNPTSVSEFTATISNSSTTDFEYVSSKSYFRDVITDQTGVMKSFCDAFAKNGAVANQITSGNYLIRLNILISEGFDRFEISKLTKSNALVSTEAVSVITNTTQAGKKFYGVEKDRIRYSACAAGAVSNQFSSVRQTWLTALTPF